MHIDNARELKARLLSGVVQASSLETPTGVASVGISVLGRGTDGPRYGLAVRYSGNRGEVLADSARALAARSDDLDTEVDIREIGLVQALTAPTEAGTWAPEALQRKVRPLHPGLSIAQRDVTAGTLGGFVRIEGSDGLYVLSNNHVLANSDQAALEDPVLQPGPYDQGTAADRVGRLARAVPLEAGGGNTVDAAIALLEADLAEVDLTYPVGRLVGWAEPDDEVAVEKVGRTTGWTKGRISAIELDDVAVQYPVGVVSFDGQIEVTGASGAFSAGGDSGSIVYRPDTREAVGLLFAGSERGGDDGAGLTFCNPIGLVLAQLGATLVV